MDRWTEDHTGEREVKLNYLYTFFKQSNYLLYLCSALINNLNWLTHLLSTE